MSRMTEAVGRVLGERYRILAPIGKGASAQVYLADDVRLRRRVAVKVLHAALADDADFLRRFQAEARAAAALNHPNVMAVYDWGHDDRTDVPYLVLEYLAGGSLRAILDRGDRLTPSQGVGVGLDTARALEYAHHRGFVHRDIKPANLLFGEEGRLRVADFGLARALAEAAWTEPQGALLGTARYASPEQVQGLALTGKADVYSLALVLVEAVTGQVPFAADTTLGTLMARVDRHLEVPDELGPLAGPLRRAGVPDPDERIDAHEFVTALLAAANDLPRPAPLALAGALEFAEGPADDAPTMLGLGSSTVVDLRSPRDDDLDVPDFVSRPAPPAPDSDDLDAWPFVAAPSAVPDPGPATVALTLVDDAPGPVPAPPETLAGADDPGDGGDGPDEPRRRRWPKRVLTALVALAVLATAAALVVQLTATPTHAVPPVVGLDVSAARAQLAPLGFDVVEQRTRFDGTTAGQVLGVTPSVGTELSEGAEVELLVSDGSTIATVPVDLAGLPLADATARVEDAGFGVATTPQFHEEVPVDHVIGTAPGTPAELERGREVTLVVSLGPEPRTIPDGLAGQPEDVVVGALSDLGLAPTVERRYSDDVEAGVVMGTEPGAGQQLARGAEVVVVVSDGPEPVPVPDVSTTDTPQEAAALLRAAGLVPGDVSGPAEGAPAATDPPAGTEVRPGSTVDIILR